MVLQSLYSIEQCSDGVTHDRTLTKYFTLSHSHTQNKIYVIYVIILYIYVHRTASQQTTSATATQTGTATTIGGLYGLLEDILALLPQDEIFILFFDKLNSSPAFSNMVAQIGSHEFGMKFDSLKVLYTNVVTFPISVKKCRKTFNHFFVVVRFIRRNPTN